MLSPTDTEHSETFYRAGHFEVRKSFTPHLPEHHRLHPKINLQPLARLKALAIYYSLGQRPLFLQGSTASNNQKSIFRISVFIGWSL